MAQTSQHYYIEGLKGALNWTLIMPRNASLSRDSRSKVFFYFKINIYFYLNWKKKAFTWIEYWNSQYIWICPLVSWRGIFNPIRYTGLLFLIKIYWWKRFQAGEFCCIKNCKGLTSQRIDVRKNCQLRAFQSSFQSSSPPGMLIFLPIIPSNSLQPHWENFFSISFHIEWDKIVVTVFLLIFETKTVTTIVSHSIWKEMET